MSGLYWTNGDHWQAHRVLFEKPIKTEVVFDVSLIESKNISELVDVFFLLSKEGVKKSAIDIFHEETQLTSRYMIAATLLTEPVLAVVRRQLRALSNKVKITNEDIQQAIETQVLKREVIEGEEAAQAKKRLAAAARAKKRAQAKKQTESARAT